ncbi:MAG: hypothetical protein COX90_03385 [Candidatus Nealsonbacteria bacterium CG_4_10_14_0_2_um_filter_38_17]|uniref:DNA polymerase III subunit gamma/tau n=1 Tax=Candidatus Nealsonbacteria bacterium CG_4_10_14_0_2_um_filter_38_17 TaxID=1974680 RepID=A0A2M7UXG7_9BACT|nr:MAG: hypothetical protein COX90_03385 [Candidatus Nealsonbacteria bacterium CG_4_10_14_0_2_um_filter_38_17]
MANLVLYRKYRPQTFSEVIGQEHVVKTLINAISMGMISHAYLFAGPRGSGKTSIARLFAKSVNCKNRKEGEFEPCNKCDSCLEINQGNSMDLIEIDAASHRGIDDIRELRDGIRFSPAKSKYKVFIIDECLTGDHFVSMADGTVKQICEAKNGDKIASIDIKTGEIIEKPITNWFRRKTDVLLEIKTPQTFLRVTPSHRLWVLRDSKLLLMEAKNLKKEDFLLSPVFLPHIQKNNLTPQQLRLLAIIQCDGHVSKDSNTIQIEIRKDKDYFKEMIEEGLRAWQIKEKPVITVTSRGTRLIRIYSKELKKILISLACPEGKKGGRIDIPNSVFQTSLESIKAYVDTCFCCEGNVDFNKTLNLYRLHFNSTSEIFVKKLQFLLKKFGIASSFISIPKKKKNKQHSDQYRLTLSHYDLKLFYQNIGLSLKRKNRILEKCSLEKERQDSVPIKKVILQKRKEKSLRYSEISPYGIYPAVGQHLTREAIVNFIKVGDLPELNKYLQFRYEKIKRINTINKKEYVYDFTVEDTHIFVANGICSSNCHQLTKEAANALLKTLEEPPSHAIFILATTEVYKMIPTILSRCQRFDFRKLTLPEIIKRLEIIAAKEKVEIEKAALELIALNSGGSFRDAESLLDQVFTFSGVGETKGEIKAEEIKELLGIVETAQIIKFVDLLLAKKSFEAVGFLNELLDKGFDLQEFIKSSTNYLRQALILKIGGMEAISIGLTKEELQKLQQHAQSFTEQDLRKILNLFLDAENKIRFSPIPQLPIELAIIEFCSEH